MQRARAGKGDVECTGLIVDAAMNIHSALGPGLLESAYQACLAFELRERGLSVEVQVPLPVIYRGVQIDTGYRIDLLVNHSVVIEVKAVGRLIPLHAAQLLSYLRLSGHQTGLLINFHEERLKHGIRRMINDRWLPKP